MEINIKHEEALTIELTGRLDTVTSTELADAMAKETITEKLVVIDFKALEYISSAGSFKVTGFINILTVK